MQRLLRRTLELAGYRVAVAGDGLTALEAFEAARPDVVLLDMVIPGIEGIEVCRRIRAQSQLPIVILSALGREQDKIRGLDAGADDYVTKPFSAGELLARIKSVLRRSAWSGAALPSAGLIARGDVEIDLDQHLVRRNGDVLPLTALEFRLLAFIAGHSGRVLTHAMILASVWGHEYTDELHMLRVNVSRLRQKVERDAANPELVLTVPGVGYTMPSK